MKARIGFCTWRPLVGVAVVGALAFAVGVQGSPRVGGERGKDQGKSPASRVVTGPSAHINSAIAVGATAVVTLQPVAPKTVPASTYPAGSTIVAQTLTLSSVPPGGQHVWFELRDTNWAPQILKTIQATLSATDPEGDGGGLSGANASCMGGPGGADLQIASMPCTVNTDCRASTSGIAGACGFGEPSSCKTAGGANFPYFLLPPYNLPAGKYCEPGFQDLCNTAWTFAGVPVTNAVDYSTQNIRAGGTTNPGEVPPDNGPSYFGTIVINVPAGAKGNYTLDFVETGTFMQELDALGNTVVIPIASLLAGVISVPCGSCCYGVGTTGDGCVDRLSKAECDLQPAVALFNAGGACVNPPTADGCCACLTNDDCKETPTDDLCTTDICNSCVCSRSDVASWNPANECCNALDGSEDPIVSPDQCVTAACSLPGSRGDVVLTDRTGLTCSTEDGFAGDGNPCTTADICVDGAGSCAGTDINTIDCTTSADCPNGLPCEGGKCKCTLTPDLTIVIDDGGKGDPRPGDLDCYNDGTKITGFVHIAAATTPINGGQFALTYDPTCLQYNGIAGVGFYGDTVYGPVVDQAAGTIFIAVGVGFGMGNGPPGQTDMLGFSFFKIGTCNHCDICFTDINPYHTYLVDHEGQRIGVQAHCSKEVFANNDVELGIPGNIETNVDCDRPTAIETWNPPSVTDSCGTSTIECVGSHENGFVYGQNTILHGGEFPVGASTFCCQATSDYCGKVVGCLDPTDVNCPLDPGTGKAAGCWTVQVNDETSLDITVGLSPTAQSKPGSNLTRCIKFTLFSDCISEPLVFSEDVVFGGMFDFVGKFNGKIKIPGSGQWDCITAQDQLHTLRSCYTFGPNDCVGGQLNASFSGDPRLGGNWLIGGNLDGWKKDDPTAQPSLDVIDILDYGTFLSQFGHLYGAGDTPCGTQGPNADINGDGIAGIEDYAFISMNFLTSSKLCCCGPQTAGVNAITEISVAQLRAMGLADLAVADLNGDGMLNLADMAAFDAGARPAKTTPTKGGVRSSGSR